MLQLSPPSFLPPQASQRNLKQCLPPCLLFRFQTSWVFIGNLTLRLIQSMRILLAYLLETTLAAVSISSSPRFLPDSLVSILTCLGLVVLLLRLLALAETDITFNVRLTSYDRHLSLWWWAYNNNETKQSAWTKVQNLISLPPHIPVEKII